MPKQYDPDHIWQMLQKNRYCTVADHASDGTINARVMAFACSRDLKEFYLMTPKIRMSRFWSLTNRKTQTIAPR
jgi:general stress protein 26